MATTDSASRGLWNSGHVGIKSVAFLINTGFIDISVLIPPAPKNRRVVVTCSGRPAKILLKISQQSSFV